MTGRWRGRLRCTVPALKSWAVLCILLGQSPPLLADEEPRRDLNAIATEDPFLDDEITLAVRHRRERVESGKRGTRVTAIESEYAKSVGLGFTVLIGGSYQHLDPADGRSRSGAGNLELGGHYLFFDHPKIETAASAEIRYFVGGIGDERAGADAHSIIEPDINFAKGFGGASERLKYLRPLGVTVELGAEVPVGGGRHTASEPDVITLGFSAQYDVGRWQKLLAAHLPGPLPQMAPIVEFEFETCVEHGCSGETSAFAYPGLLWTGKNLEYGIEAQVPLNGTAGGDVGVLSELTVSLEDLYPPSWRLARTAR
jgi:hypothetical protein